MVLLCLYMVFFWLMHWDSVPLFVFSRSIAEGEDAVSAEVRLGISPLKVKYYANVCSLILFLNIRLRHYFRCKNPLLWKCINTGIQRHTHTHTHTHTHAHLLFFLPVVYTYWLVFFSLLFFLSLFLIAILSFKDSCCFNLIKSTLRIIFDCLFSVHHIISLSLHEQVCLEDSWLGWPNDF